MLLNLASNAVKDNRHAGTIRIACQAAAGGRVAIVVTDTGPGLSADKVEGQGTTFTVELPERSHRPLSGTPSRP